MPDPPWRCCTTADGSNRIRYPPSTDTAKVVGLFRIEEELLVPGADLSRDRSPDQHRSSRRPVGIVRIEVVRRAVDDLGEESRPSTQPAAEERVTHRTEERRLPAKRGIDRTVLVENERHHRPPDPVVAAQRGRQTSDGVGCQRQIGG